jgi:hypothetical protein
MPIDRVFFYENALLEREGLLATRHWLFEKHLKIGNKMPGI